MLESPDREGLVGHCVEHKEAFLRPAPYGQNAVRGRLGERFGPLEVIFVIGGLGGLRLAGNRLRDKHRMVLEDLSHFAVGGGGHFLFDIDIFAGLDLAIKIALLEDHRRQRLQAALFGDCGAGSSLGTKRQVYILQDAQRFGGEHLCLQFVGKLILFLEALEDRLAALIELT